MKIARLKWIDHINRKEQLIRFLPTNLKEVGRGAGLNQGGGIVCIMILRKCNINRWNARSKDREDWKRLVEEAKVHIGL